MIKRSIALLLGSVLFFFAFPLCAQEDYDYDHDHDHDHDEDVEIGNGFYAQLSIGPSFFESDSNSFQGSNVLTRLDTGFNAGAAVGYRFSSFRVEVAGDYHRGEVDTIKVSGNRVPVKDGELALVTVMANGYIDLDLGLFVIPYVGFGIGGGVILANETSPNAVFKLDDDAAVFTWNAMAGLNWNVYSNIQVMTGYRYVSTTEADLGVESVLVGAVRGKLDTSVAAHELVIGVRYNF